MTQAALLKRSNNESVLAIQPHHQSDQPEFQPDPESSTGLWKTLLIWGAVVIGILCLAAVAPLCHYRRLGTHLGTQLRLVGKPPLIFYSF